MKGKVAIAFNIFIGTMTIAAWVYMTFFSPEWAALSSNGLESLKFFTVLSNLFNGIVAFAYLAWVVRKEPISQGKTTLKLVANSAVGLTFATVMLFLGPLYGYGSMFEGANLWLHLILPVASFVSFIFFEQGGRIAMKQTLWAMLPTAAYAAVYLANIAINGIGEWPHSNDFYGFLLWGNGVGAIIACAILLITWLISLALRQARSAQR